MNDSETAARLTPLFNRSADGSFQLPPDGWFHLVPKGRFPILDPSAQSDAPIKERIMMQVVDDRAVTLMLNRFAEEAKGENFPGLLIDYDHFSYDLDKPSVAAGWVKELKNRENGIWGRIEWTPKGQQSLTDGEYRFVSPVWDHADTEPVRNREVRPKRLETFGLVNKPNLRGMVPLSNRDLTARSGSASEGPETKQMKQVSTKLGLSPDASEEAVLAAVTKLMNRATEVETENGTLKIEIKDLSEAQIESDLEKFKNRFKPENKDKVRAMLLKNRAGTIELLEATEAPVIPATPAGAKGGKMLNRKEASTPEGGEATPQDGKVRASKIESLAGEYKMKNRCSLGEAYDAVERMNPELFQEEEAK